MQSHELSSAAALAGSTYSCQNNHTPQTFLASLAFYTSPPSESVDNVSRDVTRLENMTSRAQSQR